MSERAYNKMMKHFRMGAVLFIKWLRDNNYIIWHDGEADFMHWNMDDTETYLTFDEVYELYEQDEIKSGGLA